MNANRLAYHGRASLAIREAIDDKLRTWRQIDGRDLICCLGETLSEARAERDNLRDTLVEAVGKALVDLDDELACPTRGRDRGLGMEP